MGIWGQVFPRDMPTPGANLILGQTGLSRALGAHDPPCRVSEECLPGLLSMGQPSRWTRSDNTPPSAIRGLEVWVPPPAPSQGQGAVSTGVTQEHRHHNPDRASAGNQGRRTCRGLGWTRGWSAAPWASHQGASSWAGLDRGGETRQSMPTAAPGLSTPTPAPETGGHSLHAPITLSEAGPAEVLSGQGGRAHVPDLPYQGSWGRAAVSSDSQEGLRPDCSKAQGLYQLRADMTRFL